MSLHDKLVSRLQDAGFTPISTQLAGFARESIRMRGTPAPCESIRSAASKLGGLPDLPPHAEWPRWKTGYLQFVAQVNLAELPPNDLLPHTGLLSFFYDREQSAWGFDPNHRDGFRLWYFPDTTNLVRASKPDSSAFPCVRLSFELFLSLPDSSAEQVSDLLLELEDSEKYVEFIEEHVGPAPEHWLFGWPHIIQNQMELQCQLVTNGLYTGNATGYGDPRRKELEPGAADWTLLLQIDSDDNARMMWGDVGRLYVWIRHQDLHSRNFDKAWTILQCY
jgi:uncharacterized protein YwqG